MYVLPLHYGKRKSFSLKIHMVIFNGLLMCFFLFIRGLQTIHGLVSALLKWRLWQVLAKMLGCKIWLKTLNGNVLEHLLRPRLDGHWKHFRGKETFRKRVQKNGADLKIIFWCWMYQKKSVFQLWKMSFRRVFVQLWVFGVFSFLPQSWELHTTDRMRSSYFPANFRVVSPSSQLANPWAGLANLRAGISWKREQNWDLCKMLKNFSFSSHLHFGDVPRNNLFVINANVLSTYL
jgi:hypothetical protein